MTPWGVAAVALILTWLAGAWALRRLLTQGLEMGAAMAQRHDVLLTEFRRVRQQIEDFRASLEAPPAPNPLTGISFLPTDESAVDFERRLKEAEDHAVSAGEPTRFSSQPSPTSPRGSARVPSTQRVRTSGRP